MSAWVSTHTLFTDAECLMKALETVGTGYRVEGERIITDRRDYYGEEQFVRVGETFIFKHDSAAMDNRYGPIYPWNKNHLSDWKDVGTFLTAVDTAYKEHYSKKIERLAEEERIREEERKKQIVESKKSQIIEKARAKGYHIQETRNGKQIQLVLVKTVY